MSGVMGNTQRQSKDYFPNVRMSMIRTMQTPTSKLAKLTPAELIVSDSDDLVDLKV